MLALKAEKERDLEKGNKVTTTNQNFLELLA